MVETRKHESRIGISLTSKNAKGNLAPHGRAGTVAVAVLALGLVALMAVLPATAADAPQYRDDNNNGKCPGSYTLIHIGSLNAYLEAYDLNQDGLVCGRGLY
jgi:hypothetical protein